MNDSGNPRHLARITVSERRPVKFDQLRDSSGHLLPTSKYFGVNVFNLQKLQSNISRDSYNKLLLCIQGREKLDKETANNIATAVKTWAIANGATHFCHWFQPQTGLTAEKHESFLGLDENGHPVEKLSGSQLIQSEPDASSFPSGGMRTTFEARGYTGWDPSSPMFLMESVNGKTLCIPSVFISYHGNALDKKTPLLKSLKALNHSACELLTLLGEKNVDSVTVNVGPEQEYFLVDQAYYFQRDDLLMAGRTLVGSPPPKGQQMEDHYFGSIHGRVLAFMQEAELELYKLGIPAKARHNEVAPGQFEIAPLHEEANIAADHNQLVMEVLKRIARKHRFALLLHEKPFAGINGSGKHINWSIQTNKGRNVFEPGTTLHDNRVFLSFLACTTTAVFRHNAVLRSSVASAENDHRLGANEAPPAILSVFLGHDLTGYVEKIVKGDFSRSEGGNKNLSAGIDVIPAISQDTTDRNRTSPFAFTGNKFEFRAAGSSSSISTPLAVLNAAVADVIKDMCNRIKGGQDPWAVTADMLRESTPVRFEGNNYSKEWHEEAERRGLPNNRNTPQALKPLRDHDKTRFLGEAGVFSDRELESRYEIELERYIKQMDIEVTTLKNIVRTKIIPPAQQARARMAKSIIKTEAITGKDSLLEERRVLEALSANLTGLHQKLTRADALMHNVYTKKGLQDQAELLSSELTPWMQETRALCDMIEDTIDDNLWMLPKYSEMLKLP